MSARKRIVRGNAPTVSGRGAKHLLRPANTPGRPPHAPLPPVDHRQQLIGMQLQDGVCQELAGIAFLVQALKSKVERGAQLRPEDLSHVLHPLQSCLRNARGLSQRLLVGDPDQPRPIAENAANSASTNGTPAASLPTKRTSCKPRKK